MSVHARSSARRTASVVALVVAAVVAPTLPSLTAAGTAQAAPAPTAARQRTTVVDAVQAAAGPGQTLVRDAAGKVVARFTLGARTVVLSGRARTFAEASTTRATVTTTAWVRLLPAPFAGTVDTAWLATAAADTTPDVLAVTSTYLPGSPAVRDAAGQLMSSDASYGPQLSEGGRQEGSDWNDYQQVTATYGTTVDRPEAAQTGAADCSGWVRMVFGRHNDVPLSLQPTAGALPRRAVQMAAAAPGTRVLPLSAGRPATASLAALQPGDLLFFDAATDDGTAIDHVAIHLGNDSAGKPRFVSSRKTADGPTMGDVGGASVLTGSGLYAGAFRGATRL